MKRSLAAVSAALLTSGVLACVATTAHAAPPAPRPGPSAVGAGRPAAPRPTPAPSRAPTASRTRCTAPRWTPAAPRTSATPAPTTACGSYGGDFVVHTAANGSYAGTSVGLAAPLTLSTTAKVGAAAADEDGQGALRRQGHVASAPRSCSSTPAPAGAGWPGRPWSRAGHRTARPRPGCTSISDATTGALPRLVRRDRDRRRHRQQHLLRHGQHRHHAVRRTYQMIDPSHGNGRTCDMNNGTGRRCTTFTDADNVWGNGTNSNRQSAGVDAHYGAAKTFDYYKNVHGRNGIFGNGTGVPSRVHYGSNYVNAFWDGAQMTYGDGSGNATPLVALDVAGHEMSHGVTENVVPGGLTYSGESGGLNEATSDIFGTMVEFYANTPSRPGRLPDRREDQHQRQRHAAALHVQPVAGRRVATAAGPPRTEEQGRALLLRRRPTTSSSTSPRAPAPPRTAPRRSAARRRRSPASAGPRPRRSGSGRWTCTSPPTPRTSTPATRRTPRGPTACGRRPTCTAAAAPSTRRSRPPGPR